jgi:hypothetical protein
LSSQQKTAPNRLGAVLLALVAFGGSALLLGTARAPSSAAGAATVDLTPNEREAKVSRLVSSMFERRIIDRRRSTTPSRR